jgi:hypothetical protein
VRGATAISIAKKAEATAKNSNSDCSKSGSPSIILPDCNVHARSRVIRFRFCDDYDYQPQGLPIGFPGFDISRWD